MKSGLRLRPLVGWALLMLVVVWCAGCGTSNNSDNLSTPSTPGEFLYIVNPATHEIIALKSDLATGTITQQVQYQTLQLDDSYNTSAVSAVPSSDGRLLFVMFNGSTDGGGNVAVPGLLKVFSLDPLSGRPQEVAGSALGLSQVGQILRAKPAASFLYVKTLAPAAMVVIRYDASTGALTLGPVDTSSDVAAITDFAIASNGGVLSAIAEEGTDAALVHFTINPGDGGLIPSGTPETIPLAIYIQAASLVVPPVEQIVPGLYAASNGVNFETVEYGLVVFPANAITGTFDPPNTLSLGVYNSDAKTGTRAHGLLVSPDGHNLFFNAVSNTVFLRPNGLVFAQSCGLGRVTVELTTGLPSFQPSADFGSQCVLPTSGVLNRSTSRYYLKTGANIVGAGNRY